MHPCSRDGSLDIRYPSDWPYPARTKNASDERVPSFVRLSADAVDESCKALYLSHRPSCPHIDPLSKGNRVPELLGCPFSYQSAQDGISGAFERIATSRKARFGF